MPRRRGVWLLAVVLTTTMGAASIFQFVIAALGPTLVSDAGLSRLGLGLVPTGYYLCAAAASLVLGRRIDWLAISTGTFLLFVLSAVAFSVIAVRATQVSLVLAACLAGVAAGLANPVTNRVVAERPGPRGVLVGFKQAGVQLSAVVAGTMMPRLTDLLGWRGAISALAGFVLVLGVVLARWFAGASARGLERPDRPARTRLPRTIRWLALYAFLMGAGMSAVTLYIALYAHEVVGLDGSRAAGLLAVIGLAGGLTRLVSSILAEKGDRLGHWMTAGACVAVSGVFLIAISANAWVVLAGAVVVGLSGAAWNGVAVLAVLRTSLEGTGHATGLMQGGFFIGLAVAPPAFGGIVDATHSYSPAWAVAGCCFGLAALVGRPLTSRYAEDRAGVSRRSRAPSTVTDVDL